MTLAVLGAAGPTGRLVVEQAAAAGHHVLALSRRTGAIPPSARVTPAVADVLDGDQLTAALAGADAVVSAIGVGLRTGKTTLYSAGVARILAAMQRQAIRRLVVVSSSGITPDPATPRLYRWFVRPLLREIYRDMARMESLLRFSDSDWTILRPAGFTHGGVTRAYRMSSEGIVPGGSWISRGDVAHALLRVLAPQFIRKAVAVAY